MAIKPFIQFFSSNGDGTGTTNMGVNGSVTQQTFTVDGPTDGTSIRVARLIVAVEDNASMTNTTFGAVATLSTGVGLEIVDSSDATMIDLTPIKIKQNGDWGRYAYDVEVHEWGATPTNRYLGARWTFSKFVDGGIVLNNGEKIECNVDDDLSALVGFTIVAEGEYLEQRY